MKSKFFILILVFFISHLPAQSLYPSEPIVRVRIINALDSVNIKLKGEWNIQFEEYLSLPFSDQSEIQIIKSGSGLALAPISERLTQRFNHLTLSSVEDTATVSIADVPYGVGWWWGGSEDRIYNGIIHIYMDAENNMSVSVHLPLEQYLKGVVPYEIGGSSPLEALKAQAVAARSEAVIALKSGLYGGVVGSTQKVCVVDPVFVFPKESLHL